MSSAFAAFIALLLLLLLLLRFLLPCCCYGCSAFVAVFAVFAVFLLLVVVFFVAVALLLSPLRSLSLTDCVPLHVSQIVFVRLAQVARARVLCAVAGATF